MRVTYTSISIGLLKLLAAETNSDFEGQFADFKREYGKLYKDAVEENIRFSIFKNNLEVIAKLNAKSKYATFGINQFTDMTDEEVLKPRLGTNKRIKNLEFDPDEDDEVMYPFLNELECPYKYKKPTDHSLGDYSEILDYRDRSKNPYNVIADVGPKDQAACGSCYSFSAVAAMEGSMCRQNFYDCDSWQGLSEQHVLNCGTYLSRGNESSSFVKTNPWYEFHGCGGGMQSNVFQWAYKNRGILAEAQNGYNSGDPSFYDNKMNVGECVQD